MARKYKKDIKVVLPHIDPFRDIAVYGAGEEMIKAMGGVVHAGIKKPAIVPTSNNPYFKKYGDGGIEKPTFGRSETYAEFAKNEAIRNEITDAQQIKQNKSNKFSYKQKDKVKKPAYEIQLPELTIRPEESSKKELDISINPTKQPPALNFTPPRIPGSRQEAQAMLDSGELKASPPDYSFGTKQQAKLALKLLGLRYPAAAVAGSLWDVYDGDYKEAALNVMPFKKFGAIGQGTGATINANDVYDQFMKVKKERETYKENKNYSKGGSIKKFGDGGTNPPITLNNINDPRLQAYNDSLSAYNFGNVTINASLGAIKKSKALKIPIKHGKNKQLSPYYGTNILPYDAGYVHPNLPGRDFRTYLEGDDISLWEPYYKFKKPVQPYIYEEPKDIEYNNFKKPYVYKKPKVQNIIQERKPNLESIATRPIDLSSMNVGEDYSMITPKSNKKESKLSRLSPYTSSTSQYKGEIVDSEGRKELTKQEYEEAVKKYGEGYFKAYGGYIRKYADGGVEDKEVPINAANPYLILDEGKEFTVRPEEEAPEDTYANYMANKNKDASLAEAMFVTPIDYVASYPQAAMMKALTGKYGEPSDKIGYENPEGFLQHAWNFGVNSIVDPTNIGGVGLIDDVAKMGLKGAAKNSIKNTGNALYSIADNIDNTVGDISKRVNKGLYSTGDFIDRNVNNIQAAVTGDYKKAIKQRGTGLATYNNPSLDEGKLAFEQRKAEKLAFWETPEGNQRLADHLERNNSPLSAKEFKRDFKDNVHYSTAIKERRVYQKELIEKADFEFHKKRDLEKKMDSIYGRISRARAVNKDPNIPANIKKANAEDLNNLSKEWQDTFDETTYQEELLKKLEKDIELHNFDKDNAYSWGNHIYIGEDLSHPVNLGGTMEHELSGHAVDMKSQAAGYKPKINNTSITQNLLDNVDLEASDMPDHIQELFRKHGDKKELKKFLKSMTKENYSPEYQQFLQNPIGYFKGSKNYWLKGAKGQNNEPTAFMAEARDYLFKKGHTKTLEEPITEDILEKAFTEYRKDRNMKGIYRLFDIVNPTKKSIKTLTKEINALPIIAAPILGATAVGTLTDQLPEQAPAQYSYGGYYKKYK